MENGETKFGLGFGAIALILGTIVWTAFTAIAGEVRTATFEALRYAFTVGSAVLGNISIEWFKQRGKLADARALVLEELREALGTCDDKISYWRAIIQNTMGGDMVDVVLYPTVSTFAFEAVAATLAKVKPSVREPVFAAYYYLQRRRDDGKRRTHAMNAPGLGRDAIVEIEKMKQAIEAARTALAGYSPWRLNGV